MPKPKKSAARLDAEIAAFISRRAHSKRLYGPQPPETETSEQAFQRLEEEHYDFLFGRCATLAIALHRISGLPIYGLVGYDEEGTEVLVHAYVKLNEQLRVDLKGPRSLDDILMDFADDDATADSSETSLSEQEVAKLATGSSRCPSLRAAQSIAARVWTLTQQQQLPGSCA